jgi:ribosomal protein S9
MMTVAVVEFDRGWGSTESEESAEFAEAEMTREDSRRRLKKRRGNLQPRTRCRRAKRRSETGVLIAMTF